MRTGFCEGDGLSLLLAMCIMSGKPERLKAVFRTRIDKLRPGCQLADQLNHFPYRGRFDDGQSDHAVQRQVSSPELVIVNCSQYWRQILFVPGGV
jgi:hypothetical protein